MSSTEGERIGQLLFASGAEVEAVVDREVAKWLEVGFSTEPSYWTRAEYLLRRVYRLLGVDPGVFVRAPSPRALLRAFPSFRLEAEPDPAGGVPPARAPHSAFPALTESAPGTVLFAPIRIFLQGADYFREAYRPGWTRRLERSLHHSVTEGFHHQVWQAAFREVHGDRFPWPFVSALGQSDVPAVAHRRLLEELGLWDRGRRSERVALRESLARACGWVWEFQPDGTCAVVDRPAEVHMETTADGPVRIHREDGPAVTFRDGWEVWAWHGVSLPRKAVEAPETLRPEEIREEQGAQARRTMLYRLGLGVYLEQAGGELVDEVDEEKAEGPIGLRGARLVKGPWRGREPLAAVCLVDRVPDTAGAPKQHWIRVPPGVGTVREAVAWAFWLEEGAYQPLVET